MKKSLGFLILKVNKKHFFDQKFGAIDSEVWFWQNVKFIFVFFFQQGVFEKIKKNRRIPLEIPIVIFEKSEVVGRKKSILRYHHINSFPR